MVIPRAVEINEHVSVRGVVTDALDKAATGDRLALERRAILKIGSPWSFVCRATPAYAHTIRLRAHEARGGRTE